MKMIGPTIYTSINVGSNTYTPDKKGNVTTLSDDDALALAGMGFLPAPGESVLDVPTQADVGANNQAAIEKVYIEALQADIDNEVIVVPGMSVTEASTDSETSEG